MKTASFFIAATFLEQALFPLWGLRIKWSKRMKSPGGGSSDYAFY